jgi:hypothetical protein
MDITRGKLCALVVAFGYLVLAVATAGWDTKGMLAICATLLLPLALIWFPDQLGGMTGPVWRGGYIDNETPPFLVSFVGWLFLIGGPLIAYLLWS